jgi:Fe-S cluster assembly ATP-binding protein
MENRSILTISNLHAKIEDQPILKGLNLEVNAGEIHAIMGPNGAGKSTLAKVLAGHPSYEVTSGDMILHGTSILDAEPEERVQQGLFKSFQYPLEVHGISNFEFLFAIYTAQLKAKNLPLLSKDEFEIHLDQVMTQVQMKKEFLKRELNTGFSGGEKKRNEILQMALLDPSIAILDETDSGLDVDALKVVALGIKQFFNPDKGLILITHYQRLLELVEPDFIHIMIDGKIVATGDKTLALEIEKHGYDAICSKVE